MRNMSEIVSSHCYSLPVYSRFLQAAAATAYGIPDAGQAIVLPNSRLGLENKSETADCYRRYTTFTSGILPNLQAATVTAYNSSGSKQAHVLPTSRLRPRNELGMPVY